MLFLFDEYSQRTTNNLLRQSKRSIPPPSLFLPSISFSPSFFTSYYQSGQSLIEHSYKADSDLSPAGWDYADKLKAAVMTRRRQLAEERRERGEPDVRGENKLVVWTSARRRAHHTAWPFLQSGYKVVQKPQMSEINP